MALLILAVKSFFFGYLASWAYAMLFELRGRTLQTASLGGGISWLIYRLIQQVPGINYLVPFFVSTVLVSVYAELMARILKKPATVYLIVAMLPLVPGQGIYDTMSAFVNGENETALAIGGQTLAISGTLAIGILVASTLFKLINRTVKFK